MSLIEQVKEVMADHKGSAHVNDIAQMFVERFPNTPIKLNKLADKISAVLSTDARKKGIKSSFSQSWQRWGLGMLTVWSSYNVCG